MSRAPARNLRLPHARDLVLPGLAAALALAVPSGTLHAQSTCTVPVGASTSTPRAGALARVLTLHADDLTLRDAIDRVSAVSAVRISYSGDLLPAHPRVCIDWESVTLGDALSALLAGTALEPVMAGADHVVLTPARPRAVMARPSVAGPLFFPLDPVVVAAGRTDPANRYRPVDVEVIDGRELADRSASTVAAVLSGIPGIWVWPSASGLVTQFGSLRGASSFGLSAPRVYIDGIEVASPLLLVRLSADAIERIEVVRGPQGAAWFGTNAVDGVTNIITRHDVGAGSSRVRLRSGLAVSATAFAPSSPLGQDHTLGLQLGSATRSAVLNASFGSSGEVVPGGAAQHVSADGSLRLVGARTLFTATARFLTRDVGTPVSPLLPDSLAHRTAAPGLAGVQPAASVGVRQYTAGLKAEFAPDTRWTHTFVAGIDGYALNGVDAALRLTSAADSALLAAGSGAVRGTLRWTSLARTEFGARSTAAITLTAEHTRLREYSRVSWMTRALEPSGDRYHLASLLPDGGAAAGSGTADQLARTAQNTTGLGARGSLDLLGHVSLTGGVRLELSDNDVGIGRFAVLPMLGATVNAGPGPFAVALRAAYGKAVRWPELPATVSPWGALHALYAVPGPEEQSGIEAGVDVAYAGWLRLHLTRFDQSAGGLIQRVAMERERDSRSHATLQNVGAITNRGWEVQAKATRGALSIGASAALVDSRVRAVAEGYSGDLRPGDRTLAVPAHTLGITAGWQAAQWAASISAQRAGDWINHDRIALAAALAAGGYEPLQGAALRAFWRRYDGVTHINAGFRHDLPRGLALLLSAQNLLNVQVGEPDNITVLPGRTFSIGVRAIF